MVPNGLIIQGEQNLFSLGMKFDTMFKASKRFNVQLGSVIILRLIATEFAILKCQIFFTINDLMVNILIWRRSISH